MLQFSRLRSKLTFLYLAAVCTAAQADVIHLKNGGRIVADSARESNGRIEYTIGENTFSIPKSAVETIDTGPGAEVPKEKLPAGAVDAPPAPEKVEAGQDLTLRILHGGKVDSEALKGIEAEGVAQRSAVANLIAANSEEKQGRFSSAARYLQAALGFAPEHAVVLEHYASVLLQLDKNFEAVAYAERATRASPQSADALNLLGYAYYKNERNRDAVAAWKKSLALRPDPEIEALLGRVERESSAEAGFRQQQRGHFVLRYEGSQTADALRNDILSLLEAQYAMLQNDLGATPQSISVSLYTSQAFFDVTQAPAWSAALNDVNVETNTKSLSIQ